MWESLGPGEAEEDKGCGNSTALVRQRKDKRM